MFNEIITVSFSFLSKKGHFRLSGSGLSSTEGGWPMDNLVGEVEMSRASAA